MFAVTRWYWSWIIWWNRFDAQFCSLQASITRCWWKYQKRSVHVSSHWALRGLWVILEKQSVSELKTGLMSWTQVSKWWTQSKMSCVYQRAALKLISIQRRVWTSKYLLMLRTAVISQTLLDSVRAQSKPWDRTSHGKSLTDRLTFTTAWHQQKHTHTYEPHDCAVTGSDRGNPSWSEAELLRVQHQILFTFLPWVTAAAETQWQWRKWPHQTVEAPCFLQMKFRGRSFHHFHCRGPVWAGSPVTAPGHLTRHDVSNDVYILLLLLSSSFPSVQPQSDLWPLEQSVSCSREPQ